MLASVYMPLAGQMLHRRKNEARARANWLTKLPRSRIDATTKPRCEKPMASAFRIILLCLCCSGANSFIAPTPSMRPTPSTRRGKPTQALPPIWPYVGCDGCVGAGAAGLFVALVSTGFGLPVSEDVLLVSLGSRLGAMRPATIAAHCVAAVAGCALADVATVSLGCALRENEESLRKTAPGFLG